jgi:prenyltransferase beta subunit
MCAAKSVPRSFRNFLRSSDRRNDLAVLTNSQLVEARTRLAHRAEASVPVWAIAPRPCAQENATALLIGTLLGKIPADDVAALCKPILEEQLADGSWGGDFSKTLEIVQALSQVSRPETRPALEKSVEWLEKNRKALRLHPETLVMLGHITGLDAGTSIKKILLPLLKVTASWAMRQATPSRKLAVQVLFGEAGVMSARARRLLRNQLADGSWDGDTRTTALAMIALRHAGVNFQDSLFERGFRFLRVLQQWDKDNLVQSRCDVSAWMHAASVRGLLLSGCETHEVAASVLGLLHIQDQSGGWAMGSGQRVDLLTTAHVLDALTIFGDTPVETSWARRRAAEFLISAQLPSGGWSRSLKSTHLTSGFSFRGTIGNAMCFDTTIAVLASLAQSGESNASVQEVVRRAVRMVKKAQHPDGSYSSGAMRSKIWSTVMAVEALDSAGGHRTEIERALDWLAKQQHLLGGFGEANGLTSWHTAWGIRGLSLRPHRYSQELASARMHLLMRRDDESLLWNADAPVSDTARADLSRVDDVTSFAALEAMTHMSRIRATNARRSRKRVSGE